MPKTTDFLDDFVAVLRKDLERGDEKWGDTWLQRPREGQVERIRKYVMDLFDQALHGKKPMRWESLAGEALIGWVRDNHPELFVASDGGKKE